MPSSTINLRVFLLVSLVLSISALGYGQVETQKQDTLITRESLENALNGGFVVAKVQDVAIKLGGHIQTDAIHDINKTNSTVFFKPSEIVLPSEQYNRTLFNIKDSRIRVSAVNTNKQAKNFKVLLEVDFRNAGNAPRLRHAWLEYGKFGAGQTWSNFLDHKILPNIILNTGGPNSMPFARYVKFRYTHIFKDGQFAVAIEDHPTQITIPDSWEQRRILPNLTASYRKNFNKSYVRLSALVNPISYTNETDPNSLQTTAGYAASLTSKINLGEDNIKLQAAYGSGYGGYIEDFNKQNNEAVVVNDQLKTVDLFAGWLFYEHYWSPQWSTTAGYGINALGSNSRETTASIKQTHLGVVNMQYQPIKHLKFALEGIYGQRDNFETIALTENTANNVRFQFTTLLVF